jgi:hypothetical protein
VARRPVLILLACVALNAACLSTGPDANSQTFNFDLIGTGAQQWELGAADYPVGSEAAVAAEGGELLVPGSTVTALHLAGTNVSGDLFVFVRKYFTGLAPLTTYTRVALQLAYVSNYHDGCPSGPGEQVVLKGGVSANIPQATDVQGTYRMNLDKGAGTAPGDYVQLGTIANGLAGCPAVGTYAVSSTADLRQSVDLITDANGGFWIFLGTQSSYDGRHELWISQLKLRFVFPTP